MRKLSQKSDDKWRFRCYDPGRNRGGFYKWYDEQDPEIQAAIDTILAILAGTRRWDRPFFAELAGACQGLSELIVDVGIDDDVRNVRILGFSGPQSGDYTLLRGFIKNTDADYGHHCPQALKRKQAILKDARRAPKFES
jgi:hypothetical protein